jgi:hypothetical protein
MKVFQNTKSQVETPIYIRKSLVADILERYSGKMSGWENARVPDAMASSHSLEICGAIWR